MYFITTKRMLEVCFSAHPNIQYRTFVCLERKNEAKKIKYMLYPYKKIHATPRVESVYPVGHALAHGGLPRSTQWNI